MQLNIRNQRTLTARHEAAHAVMAFLDKTDWSIKHIRMEADSTGSIHFHVISTPLMGYEHTADTFVLDDYGNQSLRREIVGWLAGPVTEALMIAECNSRPVGDLVAGILADFDNWDEGDEDWFETDTGKAIRACKALGRLTGVDPRDLLEQLTELTYRVLLHPRVSQTVEALAKRLVTVKQLSGSSAAKIMRKAFGGEPEEFWQQVAGCNTCAEAVSQTDWHQR